MLLRGHFYFLLNFLPIPKHIAIIPDGNRRWARAQRLNPWEGHEEGVKTFWTVSQDLFDMGLDNLTFWAASYSNLYKRSPVEVKFLIKLLKDELSSSRVLDLALKNKVRVRVIGEWNEIIQDESLKNTIDELQAKTAHFENKTLSLLFAYDGQREMLSAVNSLVKNGNTVNEEDLRKNLWTGELPDVDLVIRTGGEPHWSAGFMMWHTANSQLHFTETLWPDFKTEQIKMALAEYERRERRLGE